MAEIFDAVLTGQLPVFQDEDLEAIVRGLAKAGLVDKAVRICHRYGELTPPLLKSVCDEIRAAAKAKGSS